MKNNQIIESEFLLYKTDNGDVKVDVLLQDETIWLTQKKIAEIFGTSPQNITLHLKSIFDEGELVKSLTCKKFLQVQKEGSREVSRQLEFYNLDAIIAVGYRVNSKRATQFRIWATHQINLDYSELQAENKIAMTMKDWVKKLDAFLQFNEKEILSDSGKVSSEIAKAFAQSEFNQFRAIQDQSFESDFDQVAKRLLEENKGNTS